MPPVPPPAQSSGVSVADDGDDFATPRPGATVVAARCWSCDGLHKKWVARRNRHHRHFAWSCRRCDVAWCGPGLEG